MAALLALTGSMVSAQGSAETWDDWYQVEVIVFSQVSPGPSDESWAIRELSYPEDMVIVEAPGPHLLEHLESLQRYEAVFTDAGVPASETGADDFLFEDRSRLSAREQMEARLRAMQRREQAAANEPAADDAEIESAGSEAPDPVSKGTNEMPVDLSSLLASTSAQSFSPVDRDERFLNSVAGSLRRSSRFRLLTHLAWRQPIAEGESWPMMVQTGEQFGDHFEVDGTLSFRRSRFLHVDADLWFTRFAENDVAPVRSVPDSIDPARAREYPDLLSALQNQDRYIPVHTHRLGTSRRMRRSELHYLDHPYFGVIVQFERYEGPDESGS